jgi:succinate dehydrogenase / fumarate reductase, cytochrome b subunit
VKFASKEFPLNWLTRATSSSIGRKLVLAVTGLGLTVFVIAHLAGNLLLYVGAGAYNDYAKKLHENEGLLMIAETGLFLFFGLHIYNALVTARANRKARPDDYLLKVSKIDKSPLAAPPSNVMVASGIIVLLFLMLHLSDFKLELRNPGPAGELPFDKAVRLLHDPVTWITYVVGSVVLGYHLSHGFQSAFQTLGFNHPKYSCGVRKVSVVLAFVIGAGFASFPIWATGVKGGATAAVAPAATVEAPAGH